MLGWIHDEYYKSMVVLFMVKGRYLASVTQRGLFLIVNTIRDAYYRSNATAALLPLMIAEVQEPKASAKPNEKDEKSSAPNPVQQQGAQDQKNEDENMAELLQCLSSDDAKLNTFRQLISRFNPTQANIIDVLQTFSSDTGRNKLFALILSTGSSGLINIRKVFATFQSVRGRLEAIQLVCAHYGPFQNPETLLDEFFAHPTKAIYEALGVPLPADFEAKRREKLAAIETSDEFDDMILAREGITNQSSSGGGGGSVSTMIVGGTCTVMRDGRTWINNKLQLTENEQTEKAEWREIRSAKKKQPQIIALVVPEAKPSQEEAKDSRNACRACKKYLATVTCMPCGHQSLCVACCRERVYKQNILTCAYAQCQQPFTGLVERAQMED